MIKSRILLFSLMTFTTSCAFFGIRRSEESKYELVVREKNKEVRLYEPQILAKVTIKGRYKEAQNKGFRVLANYIFGNNKGEKKIAMTAPVLLDSQDKGTKIAMTVPVTQKEEDKGWTIAFSMPSKFKSIEELPSPIDPQISFEIKPRAYYAAICYSWFMSREKNQKMQQDLLEWLKEKNEYKTSSQPFFAAYDPPWTIPFLRRNEMLIEITPL